MLGTCFNSCASILEAILFSIAMNRKRKDLRLQHSACPSWRCGGPVRLRPSIRGCKQRLCNKKFTACASAKHAEYPNKQLCTARRFVKKGSCQNVPFYAGLGTTPPREIGPDLLSPCLRTHKDCLACRNSLLLSSVKNTSIPCTPKNHVQKAEPGANQLMVRPDEVCLSGTYSPGPY